MERVKECFSVEEREKAVRPEKKGQFGMYLEKQWYLLTAKPALFEGKDAVEEGLIDEIGGLKNALNKLHEMIDAKRKKKDDSPLQK